MKEHQEQQLPVEGKGTELAETFKYQRENEALVKKGFWSKLRKFAGRIPFTKEAVAMYYCAIDAKTPLWAKGIAFGALAYFISPLDTIPDAFIGLGLTDDAAIIAAGVRALAGQVTEEHRQKSEDFFTEDE
ncbi:YkvA family protein [Paenibacillus tengchongensis]|uniref:YkvA family protein n=1 Tax=Paenibacillus tengchongensis TaxID=2608684 RepID=UPI00124D76A1|nr:YkvA family protein [Paenibacillus tengchongensis]